MNTAPLNVEALLGHGPASPSTRPVPLYWWSGAAPERVQLASHLDSLAALGMGGTIIAYAHLPNGQVDYQGPAPLSPQWWDLLRWFCSESRNRNLTVGLCDYNLIADALLHAGSGVQAAFGSLSVSCVEIDAIGKPPSLPPDRRSLVATVCTLRDGTRVVWQSEGVRPFPADAQHVCFVSLDSPRIRQVAGTFDPTAPGSGAKLIETFYEPLRRELGEHFGTTFTTMFQDELDFGTSYPIWSPAIRTRLQDRGADQPLRDLPLLWHDWEGHETFRLALKDACVSLLEENYFEPIFRWHDRSGLSLVMDQISRGDLRAGQRLYVDYASTMRWYHGPGNDDPDLLGERSIAAFKISSSIARLNGRTRVWNEAHYGSGWGVTPADIIRGLNVAYAAGATFYNPHAVFYTTNQSWWEWASPDFGLRPPWAVHAGALWSYAARCCALLEGTTSHAPLAVLDVSDDIAASAGETDSPEVAASLLQRLPQRGIDLDVVDGPALERAVVVGAALEIGQQRYTTVVLPGLRWIRPTTAALLTELRNQGGHVVAVGQPPCVLGTTTRLDVTSLAFVVESDESLAQQVADSVMPLTGQTVQPIAGIAMVNHRRTGDDEPLVWVTCLRTRSGELALRTTGSAPTVVWDPLGDRAIPFDVTEVEDGSHRVVFPAIDGHAYLLMFRPEGEIARPTERNWGLAWTAPATWHIGVEACLDNRFADFAPADVLTLPVQARTVQVVSAAGGGTRHLRAGDGTYWLALGPGQLSHLGSEDQVPAEDDPAWQPYMMSLRAGVPHDPTLLDHLTGPHGLKGRCPDEFLLSAAVDSRDGEGNYWFATEAQCPLSGLYFLHTGSRSPLRVWINGVLVVDQPGVAAESFPPWGLPNLESKRAVTEVALTEGTARVVVWLERCADQSARAFAVLATHPEVAVPDASGSLRWWASDVTLPISAPRAGTTEQRPTSVVIPPMAIGGRLPSGRTLRISVEGHPLSTEPLSPGFWEVVIPLSESPEPRVMTIEAAATDANDRDPLLAGPIDWVLASTGAGSLICWDDMGLGDFSGVLSYETSMVVDGVSGSQYLLELGEVRGAARVLLNGRKVCDLIDEPWTADLTGHVVQGTNYLRVDVSSGLAEHFRTIPSPYARPSLEGTGLMGPVRLLTC